MLNRYRLLAIPEKPVPSPTWLSCFPPALALCVVFFVFLALRAPSPAVGCCLLPPPPLCVSRFLLPLLGALCFFFLFLSAPPLSLAFSGFRPRWPWALALCLVRFFFVSPASWLSVRSRSFCASRLAVSCSPALPPPLLCLAVFVAAARCLVVVFFFPPLVCAPVVSRCLWFPAPGALGLGAVLSLFCLALRALPPRPGVPPGRWLLRGGCPRPPFCLAVLVAAAPCCFFFLPVCAPVVSPLFLFSAPGALGLGAVRCLFCGPPASRLSVRSRLVCVSRLAVGCSLVVAPPPPPTFCVSGFSSLPLGVPFFFPCVVRPRCLQLSPVSGPGCPWPRRCALFALLASRFSALRGLLPLSCFLPGG